MASAKHYAIGFVSCLLTLAAGAAIAQATKGSFFYQLRVGNFFESLTAARFYGDVAFQSAGTVRAQGLLWADGDALRVTDTVPIAFRNLLNTDNIATISSDTNEVNLSFGATDVLTVDAGGVNIEGELTVNGSPLSGGGVSETTGTPTITYADLTGTPTATGKYSILGSQVCVTIPASSNLTSLSSGFTITGFPASIAGGSDRVVTSVLIRDNGTNAISFMCVKTTGTIAFSKGATGTPCNTTSGGFFSGGSSAVPTEVSACWTKQ